MTSKYKNSTKEEIFCKIIELREEQFPFHQPVLQRDIFWVYCNARRYWGSYKDALHEAGIELQNNQVTSELEHGIDWWQFVEGQNQKEW